MFRARGGLAAPNLLKNRGGTAVAARMGGAIFQAVIGKARSGSMEKIVALLQSVKKTVHG